ncbi:hypothetical protein BDW59DRAFT_49846 [Aspergillus cavernicola]|uniref:Secreted protein n=1 Tax=Aspergillus cavernicola TaxID=176166 RepID=A0ABR4ILK6_9EURO
MVGFRKLLQVRCSVGVACLGEPTRYQPLCSLVHTPSPRKHETACLWPTRPCNQCSCFRSLFLRVVGAISPCLNLSLAAGCCYRSCRGHGRKRRDQEHAGSLQTLIGIP